MTQTADALVALSLALDAPAGGTSAWRWSVRRGMVPVRDALEGEQHDSGDGWLSARRGRSARERAALLQRLAGFGPLVLESPDVAGVREGLKRLVADIDRHVQRHRDLAYDEVELEIGGSE